MKTLRIPTSFRDINQLIKEKSNKKYRERCTAYKHLRLKIKSELEKAQNLSGKEIYESYDQYFEPIFSKYFYSVLGIEYKNK